MYFVGDLGISSLVLLASLVLPVIGLVIRRKWRLSLARKEEIKRLLVLAAEEAARAELEASLGYGAVSVSRSHHQCAVCYCSTTTRCARCKAVRYCSAKCQIIHWRQGHKEECRPPIYTAHQNNDGRSDSGQKVAQQDQSGIYGDRSEIEESWHANSSENFSEETAFSDATDSSGTTYGKDDETKVEFHADREGMSSASPSTSFSGFSASASATSCESSDDVSVCESISSNEPERSDRHLYADTALDMLWTTSSVNDGDQTNPLSPKFASLLDSVDSFSKLSQLKPGSAGESKCTSTSSIAPLANSKHEGSVAEHCTSSSSFWGGSVEAIESRKDADNKSALFNSKGGSKNVSSDSGSSLHFSFNFSGNAPLPSHPEGSSVRDVKREDALQAAFKSSKPTDGIELTGRTSLDAPKVGNSLSSNCKRSNHAESGAAKVLHIPNSREAKSSSFSSYDNLPCKSEGGSISADVSSISSLPLSSGTSHTSHLLKSGESRYLSVSADSRSSSSHKMHSIPSLKSGKIDVHENAANSPQVASSSSNHRQGLKNSVWKVVDQLRGSKLPKHHSFALGSEVAGRYSDKVLFPYELFVKLYNWNKVELQPCGLINCGNSCYANAVLQCLAFTRPLTAYFLQELHSKACPKKEWCFTCEFENLILKAKEGKCPVSPIGILSQLQNIGSQLGNGKEEDAHEFLRYAIDTMQSVCLKEAGVNTSGSREEETTLIGLTFGGYLRSKIKCMKCHGKSERHERMMDLTVEIEGDIGTLEEALRRFTGTEILDGDNKYQCSRCKSYEKAKKKLTILEAPNVLTIALKRFQSGKFGKLNKPIRFPEILDLAPYMSGTSDKSPIYRLYGVVVHLDIMNASFSGHYVCYVKNIQNKWFKIDDSLVTSVELERVLTKGAYMLLYARCSPRAPRLIRSKIISPDVKNKAKNTSLNSRSTPMQSNSAQFHSGSIPSDVSASIETFYSKFHRLQRILGEDSSSDSSSLISSNSDEGSCSTDSTRDSSSTDEFSDFIFGDSGRVWNSPWRNYSDSDASSSSSSSSPLYSKNSSLASVDCNASGPPETSGSPTGYTDSAMEHDGVWNRLPNGSRRPVDLEGKESDPFSLSDTTKHCRKLANSSHSNSFRETDSERLGWDSRLIDVKPGVPSRKSTRERID